jgi:hypothetical protein
MAMDSTDPTMTKADPPGAEINPSVPGHSTPTKPASDAHSKPSKPVVRRNWQPSAASRLPFAWARKGTTKEGFLYRRVTRDLRAQIGGKPTAAQEMLIGRIAWIQVHLATLDTRALESGGISPHATREYLAWANSMSRMLQALGLDDAPAPQPTLADYLASKAGTR